MKQALTGINHRRPLWAFLSVAFPQLLSTFGQKAGWEMVAFKS